MIRVDIPIPDRCGACPMSYWILTGPNEGRLMCEAIEYRDHTVVIVDERKQKRPDNCPIVE